jgi:TolB-like protein/DNA-binding SARP family transcriptional activator/Tfp pilus assembly protein PilF
LALLKLFGGASVETEAGPLQGPAAQRRRLAILARLALAGSQGLSRDKLIAFLWPESDTDKARHLLSDSIYRINQSLGGDVLIAGGDQLRIDFDRLRCDALEFEAALERGDPDEAVRLYRGPFLDGFFIDGALEFERWVEGERERLAHRYAGALESLAKAAETRGDHVEAARHWRALTAHDPLSSRVALRLIRALVATGDQAAALQRARGHEALLRAEWGAAPADQFAAAVAEIRAETADRRTGGQADGLVSAPAPGPAERDRHPERSEGDHVAMGAFAPLRLTSQRSRRLAGLLALAVMLVVAVVVWRTGVAARAPDNALAVAVLPFDDLSPGHDQEYLAEGVTEELIGALGGIEGLRVSSRTSAFSLEGEALDAKEVGERLGVNRVVEGSVRREGSRIRIAVRLADAVSGYQLWSTAFDREVAGMLDTQEELAEAIVGALRGRLGAGESVATPATSVDDPAAYDLYLRGRYHWHRRNETDLRAAVAAFEEAVRRAPGYARAWAGLADAYAIMCFYDWAPPREFFPRAREAALRAREAEELRGEAEATLGYVAFYHDWNWKAAEAHFREALRLEPGSSKAHQWYANFLTGTGRFREAEREMRAATELEPLSLIANAALCWVWYYEGRFDDAARQCSGTLELDSTFMLAHLWRGGAHAGAGRWDSAAADAGHAVRSTLRGTLALGSLAYALGGGGDRAGARVILDELRGRARERYQPAYEIAKAALGAGRKEEALDWLERALADRAHSMVFLKVDPQLAPLRREERFRELVRRVGLPGVAQVNH